VSESIPPPLPDRRCCGSSFLPFVAGVLVGGAAVAAAGYTYVRYERAAVARDRAAAQEAIFAAAHLDQAGTTVQGFLTDALADAVPAAVPVNPASGAAGASTEAAIKKLGEDAVDDLRQGRTLAVYRHTTKEYQKKTTREDFDKMVAEVTNLRYIYTDARQRDARIMKAAEGDSYEYYCSTGGNSFNGIVNFAFTFVPAESGGWLISDVQVSYTSK
jgi:hypothetical protein